MSTDRTHLIEAARGNRPLDIAIKNVALVNVFTCEIYPADIGIYGERIARAPLKELHLRQGALASSITHDSHNIIVAGHRAEDMLLAVQELERSGGGIVAVDGGKVLAKVELPVAGLMSLKPVTELAVEMAALNRTVVDQFIFLYRSD